MSVIITLVTLIMFNIQASAYVNRYTITIIDDGIKGTYTASEKNYNTIFEENGIDISSNDKIDISELDEYNKITINRYKTITVVIDGEESEYSTYQYNIDEFIKETKIDMSNKQMRFNKDKIENQDKIEIESTIPFYFKQGSEKQQQVEAHKNETIKEWLVRNDINIDCDYTINSNVDSLIVENMELEYHKIIKQVQEYESIQPYSIEIQYDENLKENETKVIQEGKDGVNVTITTSYYYDDSTEPYNTTKETKVKTAAVNKIVAKSKPKSEGTIIQGHKSHYCACSKCGTGSGHTASGLKVYNGMEDPHIVACNWLPLGTVIEVDGVRYTVADRGGSRLNKTGWIDIFVPEGHDACYRKGIGNCEIKIIKHK